MPKRPSDFHSDRPLAAAGLPDFHRRPLGRPQESLWILAEILEEEAARALQEAALEDLKSTIPAWLLESTDLTENYRDRYLDFMSHLEGKYIFWRSEKQTGEVFQLSVGSGLMSADYEVLARIENGKVGFVFAPRDGIDDVKFVEATSLRELVRVLGLLPEDEIETDHGKAIR